MVEFALNGALAGSQLFHQDKIDNKQLKLFVNISDITDANGRFVFSRTQCLAQ